MESITWEELENFIWKKNCSQLTIDMVQNAHQDFDSLSEFTSDEIGSFIYQMSCVLEIFNPALKEEINVLNGLMLKLSSIQEKKETEEKLTRQKFGEIN